MRAPDEVMDVHLSIDHSLGILTPKTEAGTAWMDEHLPEDRPTVGNASVVELRYLKPILAGMLDDGLIVETTTHRLLSVSPN